MGEPLSPNRVFDFLVDEPEPHPAYDFFAPGPLPGYAGNPNNNNEWIEADVPLLGELGVVADEPMVGLIVDEIVEPIVEAEEQVVAPMVDMNEGVADGFCHTTSDASGALTERLRMIENLSTRLGNLEYGHRRLVKKVQVMASQMVHAANRFKQIGTQMEQGQHTTTQRDEVIAGLTKRVQSLQKVIENGATLPKTHVVKGVIKEVPIVTAEEKAQRRLEVKARTTKKTQSNLLKQQYENFTALSSEILDQTFDRLQKLVSQLDLLDEKLLQEDVNQKLLRSLSPEWNTHAVVYEPEVKGMSSSSSSIQNMAFVSSSNNNTSSTNGTVNTTHEVSTASTQVNAAYSTNIDNLSDAVICSFFKVFEKTRRKLTINRNETVGFDKYNNRHKSEHFAGKCRALRNQDNKHRESSRRSMPVETFAFIDLVSCDGLGGHDWIDQAEEGPNYALMAFSSSSSDLKVSNDSTYSKSCLETVKLLKSQNEQLLKDFEKSELMVVCYKTGNFMPQTPDLSYTGLDKFVNKPVVENYKAKSSEEETKADEGFFVGYSLSSKAFSVFNSRTRIMEENLHIRFTDSTPNVVGSGPDWLFDIDALTRTINYETIVTGTQSNGFVVPKNSHDDGSKPSSDDGKKVHEDLRKESECKDQEKEDNINNTNNVNTVSLTVNAASTNEVNVVGGKTSIELPFDLNMLALEDVSIFDISNDDEYDDAMADMNNLNTTI
nr:hypothetical protein [Tanacetum cinerariifolium]